MRRHPPTSPRRRASARAVASAVLAVGLATAAPLGGCLIPGAPGAHAHAARGTLTAPGVSGGAPAPAEARTTAAPLTPHPATAGSDAPAAALSDLTPSIVTPGQDVTLRLTLRNEGPRAVTPTVRLAIGDRLRTRAEVAAHASSPRADLPPVLTAPAGEIRPGEEKSLPVRIPADRLRLRRPYGVLPLTITVDGLTGTTPIATFLPYHVVKEYQPLRVGVALPVTADPLPALLSGDPAERLLARVRMSARGSRLDRILQTGASTQATLVVDPALLGTAGHPAADPTAATSTTPPTPTPSPTSEDNPDPGVVLARRLTAMPGDVWFLPPGDPDVSALASASGNATLPPLPQAPTTLPGTRRPTPTVHWPVGTASAQVRRALAHASFRAPAAVLMRESRTDPDADRTGVATREDEAGRRVLAVDDRLSALLADASGPARTTVVTQHLLADSVALLAESPGVPRTVLLLPDRSLDPDPTSLTRSLRALRSAPWVTPVRGEDLLTEPTTTPLTEATTPPPGPASPLNAGNLDAVRSLATTSAGLRPAFGDGRLLPADAGEILVSTRWRGHEQAWSTGRAALTARVRTLSEGVRVVPSAINFFAEHGALQVTVVNDLGVDVHDVRLVTEVQGRPPRLFVHGPPPRLTIRAHSRATVRLDTEAVAAGVVPVRATLRTDAGTPLGEDATVRVRVQPTNGWVLLAAGGVVGIVFVLGLFRAIRAGERRVAAADLEGLDLR